ASAALALLFVPWVATCASASAEGGGLAQNIGWIARPGAQDLWQFFALLNEPFYSRPSSAEPLYARGGAALGLLLVGLPVLILFVRTLKQRRHEVADRNGGHETRNDDGQEVRDDSGRETRGDDGHEARDDDGHT